MAEQSAPERAPRRSGRALRVAALAGASALTVFLISSCSSGGDAAGGAAKNDAADAKSASVLSPSVPDRIVIPDIKVDAPLDTVGLDDQGAMKEPDFAKPMDAAWYKEGPTPGEKGAAAIVGHMDTPQTAEAVFYNLKKLKKDEKIEVHRDDGSTAVFAVDEIDTFKKDRFPTDKVYGDTHGKAELRIITCGGNLTKDRHWDANVVVFAHLVGQE
ncbi:class F sortase [Streptomyces sp. NBC_00335]|uniref:class F sortase n=1 Tax=unclassified Streptomyces TaxID=2593676 RepID=UPI002259AA88|nr:MULTISPECIES: class F sortase [unclassified Streptomyces]MCX5406400.1 class F sortase [Streptomyces sp. NBC_00086]